jgi:hypothetical protein
MMMASMQSEGNAMVEAGGQAENRSNLGGDKPFWPRARCAKPKSLRQRIALAAVWWFSAILWTDMAIGRQHHQGSAWVAAGMTWLAAFAWTWRVFRPSPSQCALPVAPQEPPRD